MKQQKIYDPHPCICCGQLTQNKTYCDMHLKMLVKPRVIPRTTNSAYITAQKVRIRHRRVV